MSSTLMFLALLPGIIIIFYVYRKDKVESEPKGLIAKLILFGAISCVPAAFAENFLTPFIVTSDVTIVRSMQDAFLIAALCEELFKFLLLWLGSWRNKAFDYRFDGIVYGVSVAVGFAVLENILYVANGDLMTALERGVLAVPLHSFCGVFMGIFYGAMKKYSILGNRGKMWRCFIGALVVPMLIHGIYDSCCFVESDVATVILLAFVVFMYIFSVKIINKFEADDWKAGFYPHLHPLYNQEYAEQNGQPGNTYGAGYTYAEQNQQAQAEQTQKSPDGMQQTAETVNVSVEDEQKKAAKVQHYKQLYDAGQISQEEYEYWRKKLLNL